MTSEWGAIVCLVITTVVGPLVASWLKGRGREQEAKALEAVIQGVEKFSAARGSTAASTEDLKRSIKETSMALNVADLLDERVKVVTGKTGKYDPSKIGENGGGA